MFGPIIIQARKIRGIVSAKAMTKLSQAPADPVCVMRGCIGVVSSATSARLQVCSSTATALRLSFPHSGVDGNRTHSSAAASAAVGCGSTAVLILGSRREHARFAEHRHHFPSVFLHFGFTTCWSSSQTGHERALIMTAVAVMSSSAEQQYVTAT